MKNILARWKWIGLGSAVIVAGVGLLVLRAPGQDGILYRQVPVIRGNIELSILATGTVAPKNRLEIKAPVAGRIEEVFVKEGQQVKKGQILATMSSTERAAMLDAARAKGADELKKWSELYLPTPVLAPINGTLILRSVEPGQTFTTTEAIFVISDRLIVQARVDETDTSQVKLHGNAAITLDAYPDQALNASVEQIAFDATTVNNVTTYVVNVSPENVPAFMRSGMKANVTFQIRSKADVLVVPNEALRSSEGHTSVRVHGKDGREIARNVRLGISDGKVTEILEGVQEGEVLLIPKVRLASSLDKAGGSPFGPPKMSGRPPR